MVSSLPCHTSPSCPDHSLAAAHSVILIKVCIFSNYKFVLNTAVIPANEPGLDLLDLSSSEYFQIQLLLPFVKIEQVYQKIEMTS